MALMNYKVVCTNETLCILKRGHDDSEEEIPYKVFLKQYQSLKNKYMKHV